MERLESEFLITSSSASITSIPEPSPLEQVANYYFSGKHIIPLRHEAAKQIILFVVSISGAGLYAVAANQYAQKHTDNSGWMRANFIIGTCASALVVLYNSTDIFFNTQHAEKIPSHLKGILTQALITQQKVLKMAGITIGAAISAIPLSLLSFWYPIPGTSLAEKSILGTITEIDNTILHFLPIELALINPIYRFPFLPFEYGYAFLSNFRLTEEEKQQRKSELKKELIFHAIKQRFVNMLTQTQQRIIIHEFSFNRKNISYQQQQTDGLYFQDNHNDLFHYLERLSQVHASVFLNSKRNSISKNLLDKFFRPLTYCIGAFWVTASCVGYLAAPVNQLSQLMANTTLVEQVSPLVPASIIASPSIYFLGVLLSFFGGNALLSVYDYLSSWGKEEVKIPLEMKLYPKTFVPLIIISMYLSCFSYAAAAELIEDNFKEKQWDTLRPFLLWLSKTGIPFLSLSAMLEFYRAAINKLILYCGNSENQLIVRLNNTIEQFKDGIRLMDKEKFLASLNHCSQKQLQFFLELQNSEDRDQFKKTLKNLGKLYADDPRFKETIEKLLISIEKLELDNIVIKRRISEPAKLRQAEPEPSSKRRSWSDSDLSKENLNSFFQSNNPGSCGSPIELQETFTQGPSSFLS